MKSIAYTLEDADLILLGKIHCCFGTMEQILQILIHLCFGLNISRGRLLTQRMDLQQKVGVLKEAVAEMLPTSKQAQRLEPLYQRIRTLADERNRLTHAAWAKSTKSDEAIAVSFKLWGNFGNMVRSSRLPGLLKEAESVQNELFDILDGLHNEGHKF